MSYGIEYVNEQWRERLRSAELADYHAIVGGSDGVEVSRSGTTRTRRVRLVSLRSDAACDIYIKVYEYRGSRWRHRFRIHKGRVEAHNYELLRQLGIPVPEVIAYGALRRGVRLHSAFLITLGVPNSITLDEWSTAVANGSEAPPSRSQRHAMIRDLAAIVAHMHAARFFHHDLQWRNVLLKRNPDGFALHLIDSARGGLRRTPPGIRHGVVRDLSSLDKLACRHISRTDRLRFLLAYRGAKRLGCSELALIARVNAYVRRKALS